MVRPIRSFGSVVLVLLFAVPLAAQTTLRDAPGGKRLLFVDGDDIRPEPGGKRLLFVDGDDIRPAPGGVRLLFVDGDDVRPEPGGIRLAFLDGKELRREPGGKVLLHIDHPDIRTVFGGKRLMFIDGEPLTKPQLVAALYHLKPELFKLTDDEIAKKKAAMKKAAEESAVEASNKLYGKFTVLNSNVDTARDAAIEVAKVGDFVSVTIKGKDGTEWYGVGVTRKVFGDNEHWVAFQPKGAVGLAVYEPNGKNLDGVWIPYTALKDGKKALGSEKLAVTSAKTGKYKITEAKAPGTGDAYAGTLQVAPAPHGEASVNLNTLILQWTLGEAKVYGIGFFLEYAQGKQALVAASGLEAPVMIGRIKETSSSGVHMDFYTSEKAAGYMLFTRPPAE